MKRNIIYIVILLVLFGAVFWFLFGREQFELPQGETVSLSETGEMTTVHSDITPSEGDSEGTTSVNNDTDTDTETSSNSSSIASRVSEREVFVTDGTKHSIPLGEILSGGPGKDGIPSIDEPKFIGTAEADSFLDSGSIGLGLVWKGEARFYPYQILVWHEIVNDTVQGDPLLVTYCPLCATGVVFDRKVNGVEQEFGVSGLLWQSNLLMYNRTGNPDTESLWSQVLGEAVLGPETGDKLAILRSDTVRYTDWKREHPNTLVLSRDTGALRNYGVDPYGDYYSNRNVSFGATFNDDRLHPKAFVLGIEINGFFKAYPEDALVVGTTNDTFRGIPITIEKSAAGEIDIFAGAEKTPIETIDGFWFSWLAVHPDTELFGN